VRTVSSPARTGVPRRSKRILALASDRRLVEQVRGGSHAAFEVVFERYGKGIISFCRHMLGSQEEAEDAVQQTFASAYADMLREEDREIRLKPWLYTIARNRCLSMLRARRDELHVEREPATTGLAEQVEQRAELRELLRDLEELPADQRAALLLAETADLSHTEIADVLECEVPRVKALVYRARSWLIDRREARLTPCEEIREQLAVLSGGSLRRSGIRHHLSSCSGCRAYREQVKRQRQMLAVVLPVAPPAWLKSSVLGASGIGGGGAAGGLGSGGAAGGLGGAVAGGGSIGAAAGAGAAGPVGSALLAKVAVVAVLGAAGAAATEAALDHHPAPNREPPSSAPASKPGAPDSPARDSSRGTSPSDPAADGEGRPHRHSAGGTARADGHGRKAHGTPGASSGRGPAEVPGSRGQGAQHPSPHAEGVPHGRGSPTAPPSVTPLKPGPVGDEPPAPRAMAPKALERERSTPPPVTDAVRASGRHDGG